MNLLTFHRRIGQAIWLLWFYASLTPDIPGAEWLRVGGVVNDDTAAQALGVRTSRVAAWRRRLEICGVIHSEKHRGAGRIIWLYRPVMVGTPESQTPADAVLNVPAATQVIQ